MKSKRFSVLMLLLTFGVTTLIGCTGEEIKEEVGDYRRAKESAKRSMEDKPYKHVPVGDPFSRVKDGENDPSENPEGEEN